MSERRAYEASHPWLSFTLDLRQVPFEIWLLLGEAQSKCQHIAGIPLPPRVHKRLAEIYMAKGALATTAIEGNTLSEDEALRRVRGELELPASRAYLGHEIDNVVRACNDIVEDIQRGTLPPLSRQIVCQANAAVLHGLDVSEEVEPGALRRHSVGVGRYRAAPWEDCEFLVDRLCQWLEQDFASAALPPMVSAMLAAIMAHLYIAWIHPFGDGNGRTARLLELRLLVAAGVPMPAAHLLSNHYNMTRTIYYRELDRASRSGGDPRAFLRYALQGFVDGLRDQVAVIRDHQWGLSWRDYVHEICRSKPAGKRQEALVLALSSQDEPVPLGRLTQLTPAVAAAYARCAHTTLERDLAELRRRGLIERTGNGYRARPEVILAFLPPRAQAGDGHSAPHPGVPLDHEGRAP